MISRIKVLVSDADKTWIKLSEHMSIVMTKRQNDWISSYGSFCDFYE